MDSCVLVLWNRLRLAATLVVTGIGLFGMGCGASSSSGPDERTAAPPGSFTDVSEAAGLGAFHHQTGAFG
jgi:hypothetical protein